MSGKPIIAIIGAGQMGSAIGARCLAYGAAVITPLSGRSKASCDRARLAGMQACEFDELPSARWIVSIVPPAEAQRVADQVAPFLAKRGPLFIDANALAPATKCAMAARIEAGGGYFVDGAIIGHPPRAGETGPRFYLSGEFAPEALALRDLGIDLRVLEGSIGTAAALKMCYASLNKGITALTSAALLAADRSGIADPLMDEWNISQSFIRDRARQSVPAMYPKAHRWIAEFEEIADFVGNETAEGHMFSALGEFFAERASSKAQDTELARIKAILDHDIHPEQ
ncbi:NAD(P)-dependent oxidoreductase [Sphingobium aromaticivastans]|uniref:NAD(P)-dependent oxidoreductase n=1 Tax=Sphingobium aromaticivastans TaxID=1778665 RepID=UPI00301AFC3D